MPKPQHKDGCTADKDLYFNLIARNNHGPDMQLGTTAYEITMDRSMSQDGYDRTIWFNYCPMCGIKYETQTTYS
jgi:hypothetical protein